MKNVTCSLATTEKQISACYPLMYQLRPHLNQSEFIEQVICQQQSGYQILQAFRDKTLSGVAGFIIGHKLAWGKHMYVDDLITDIQQRSLGVGAIMLQWLEQNALQHGCGQLRLDSGVQRFAAHKFYLREGFVISSHHFAKSLPPSN
ncbi:GNAT family N-acetyltransferase [Paraglaciecola sp. 20A4]|uniref:GNAT family N-acetyltransferase n=1 Tax=Paraglaciecola sp. 20A4 TaxID=2687288 RepID=UPI001408C6AF|nr:GNAT family N-acetyltransferase [Paraglaciecola sp. 20A4]